VLPTGLQRVIGRVWPTLDGGFRRLSTIAR
jgi:hypothetical protein